MKRIKNYFKGKMIIKIKQRPSSDVHTEATWACGGGEC